MKQMPDAQTRNTGFSIIEVFIVLVVVIAASFGGWYAWHHAHKKTKHAVASQTEPSAGNGTSSTTKAADPYVGWRTYQLQNGLSFKYPADWTAASGSGDSTGIEVNSPTNGGYYFTVQLALGSNADVNANFLGSAPGTTIAKLDAPGSATPLYLVAQNNADSSVTGLALATTPGSATTSFGILDNNGHGDKNVTMSANLVPVGSGAGVNNPYSLQTYQAQANYTTVINIFKSISE